MFVVEVGSVLTTLLWCATSSPPPARRRGWFTARVSLWLWFTVLFANFAEAVAEGRGKAQADSLRRMRTRDQGAQARRRRARRSVAAATLRKGDVVVVEAGELIPGDGEIVEGIASVDESAITGESRPSSARRRRPLGGDRRHQGALRPDRGPHRVEPRRVLPRSHDRPRRGRGAAEDARTRSRCTSCSWASRIIFLFACVTLVPLALVLGRSASPPRPSWRCWSASSRPPSAGCSRPSASPGWTGSCARTCSR